MSINKDNNLLNTKIVYDITKFTHLDFPDHLSCIIWFAGCNMRCDYCYNQAIVFAKNGSHSLDDVIEFLKTRIGLLDGVVLSGGEATDYDLAQFCTQIKALGFKIKLDTNGTNFQRLKTLCESSLIDYVALDYKAPEYKFQQVTKSSKYEEFSKSLHYLIESGIDFEARTTVHTDLIDEQDINAIIKDLKARGYNKKYYLQNFLDTGDNIGKITASKKKIDKNLLSDSIEIVFR
ncbi:anaerobic ribonucleoside-triphosphate reductase activating protein [Sulfurimonas sp. HSL-1716]|uniref:anaerobic ribonucleoside-triphosphate reductase activating protein n=1 Tax=Hydrocurvibacter sulfurireducens TaxID=3131937 RepID=UPI0031F9695D